jgi:two-component sensor histidine kinase/predicted hydrocarbon binding protein
MQMKNTEGLTNNSSDVPLYSSRIINTYLEYFSKHYPEIDIDDILTSAAMTRYEVEDPGYWFTQRQIDRFYEKSLEKTGNSNIAREVGRYTASAESTGAVKQYGLGLMSPLAVYMMVENFYRIMTRAADACAKKLGSNKVEIVVTPKNTTKERPHQCENRIGTFESLAKAFTGRYATVEQKECYHKGDGFCRYIIEWKRTPSILWRIFRNYFFVAGLLTSLILFFVLPVIAWTIVSLSLVATTLVLSQYSGLLEKKELYKTIEAQGNAAKELVNEINIRHNNALLVQEIGKATATIVNIDQLFSDVVNSLNRYLYFNRGMILTSGKSQGILTYHTGYGYTAEQEKIMKHMTIPLKGDKENSVIAACYKEQRPYLFNDILKANDKGVLSIKYFREMGTQSFICVPVVYEKKSMGVLVVESTQAKKKLTQSDMSLLIGISSQIAVGINNSLSFQKLRDSEKKLQQSHDELELHVEERTAALEEVNKELNVEVAERLKSEQRLVASLKEKDVLLKEVHHRVKNNLQIIVSLLDMSKRRAKHPETIDLLNEALSKIYTMSLIHTQLYQSDRFDEINMGRNIRDLVNQLSQFYCGDRNIELSINAPDIYLSVNQALPCALVVNELVSNAFKYAFKDNEKGKIEISLGRKNKDTIWLKVKDNGRGIPENIDIEKTETLGIKLVRNLILKQLKGEFSIKSNPGTRIDIEFPITAG